MVAERLMGAPVAAAIRRQLMERSLILKDRGIQPCLALLRLGRREDDLAYQRSIEKTCAQVGIQLLPVLREEDLSQEELLEVVEELNQDPAVHGVLLFRPLPRHLDEEAVCQALDPAKDVDGITAASMAAVYAGLAGGFIPCTARACMEILAYYGVPLAGRQAVVIGRSLVVGRPLALLLLQADATVTLCHSKSAQLTEVVRRADIVVSATGRPESLNADYVRPGQVLVDVGMIWSEEKQKLVGDVDFQAVEPLVAAITPVPGGVGAVTTAVLCSQVLDAAEAAAGRLEGV